MNISSEKDIFFDIKNSLLKLDPVAFVEKYLTLDGKPFRINGNGYKPFSHIYRYIGIKALEKNSKPVILVKGRQTGGTTMAAALEMYFMGSGIFGNGNNPPVRVIHAFPQLESAAAYSKTKLNPMIIDSIDANNIEKNKNGKSKSYIQSLLDTSSDTNNSLHFKQFVGGNHLWIESTGLNADRLRGRTADVIFFDECFPYNQNIKTENGKVPIGKLYDMFNKKETLPKVLTFNEEKEIFEYKEIVNAWKREKRKLFELTCENRKILCTGNHRFLTVDGWKKVEDMSTDDAIKTDDYKSFLVQKISESDIEDIVYDLEIKDNHNFIITDSTEFGLIAHNCQDISGTAISNATKMLTTAKYGRVGDGVQVYFGTPKKKGSDYFKMWNVSNQQYYHLGCEKCKQYFPLYTPESDEWEKIWLHGFIVKCIHCGHEQDKRPAAERGKWIATKSEEECPIIGFHINQLYMPDFTKEKILSEKPGTHPVATERSYRNEVLGEFFQGDSSPISPEEIRELCGDVERKMRASIKMEEDLIVTLGIDYGLKSNLEEMVDVNKSTVQGQSYSTAVILISKGPQLLSIEFCTKFKRNDEESKRNLIDQLMRQYSVKLAIGDIGFSQEFSEKLHIAYGDRYLVSRAQGTVNGHIKYLKEVFPKEIVFQKNFYYNELIEQLKGGKIRFPLGDYEKIAWLIQHCSNNDIKPSLSRNGDPTIQYVKSGPNDGFAALLNAYIAYKFIVTNGLTFNNAFAIHGEVQKPLVTGGYIKRNF